jgi:hypothetical protein
MTDRTALADALHNVQAAFAEAARERLALVRRLADVDVGPEAAGAKQALVAALLRREAADADETAPPADRVRRAVAQARAAAEARAELATQREVDALASAIDATWQAALTRSEQIAGWLNPRVPPETAAAFSGYVAALRALHALGATATDGEIASATATFTAALGRLERAAGGAPG